MGQKVNPVLFRLGTSLPSSTSWFTKEKEIYPHLLSQDLELRDFLSTILKTRGILLRFCNIKRSSQRLIVDLDIYFSYIMTKQAKFFWARSLFKTIKKKYTQINRIKDIKSFVTMLDKKNSSQLRYGLTASVKRKKYLTPTTDAKKKSLLSFSKTKQSSLTRCLSFKNRLFFFLILKAFSRVSYKEDIKLLSAVNPSNKGHYKDCRFVRLNLRKFKRLFILQKFRYNFKTFCIKSFMPLGVTKRDNYDLLELNKHLCKSIQRFCGVEEVGLNIYSNQLNFLPSFKFFQGKILKDLSRFQKSRDLNKYFLDIIETLYFVLRTFGYGNAYLLSQILVFLFESTRKQVFIVKFLKKSLQLLFHTIPSQDIAIDGIKILIKGRFNKRRRTKKVVLQEGQISLQTVSTPIDYYQANAVTLYGTFGIKIWISKR